MLARRARESLAKGGIGAEIFRDDGVFRRAHEEYTVQAGLAYLRVLSFDPEAFGLVVAADRAEEALRRLGDAHIRVSILDEVEEVEAGPVEPASEPVSHPYRGEAEERVCVRCGEPEHGVRPRCATCGGQLVLSAVWRAARRRVLRRWAAVFVLGLIGLGIATPRATCGSALHPGRRAPPPPPVLWHPERFNQP